VGIESDRAQLHYTMSTQLPTHERFIALLDDYPWSAFYRVGLGYVMLPSFSLLCGKDFHDWCVVGAFLGTLLSIRLVMAVLRKVLPFSNEVRTIWAERRQMAKRFDSYQWQKLFWLGIGMACYAMTSAKFGGVLGVLAVFSLTSGGLGVLLWRRRSMSMQH
jgi:hypothetical protein